MAQEKERLCGTMLARIESRKENPPTDEELRQEEERVRQRLYESAKRVLHRTIQEKEALKNELEEIKNENESLQYSIESLQRQLERSEKAYAELAQRKHELETKKNQHDEAFWVSVYWGAPFGGLALAVLVGLCRRLGLFEGFFQRFSENAETIALLACGAVVSYVAIRIYYLEKGKNRS